MCGNPDDLDAYWQQEAMDMADMGNGNGQAEYLRVVRELEGHLELIKASMDGHLGIDQCSADDLYNAIEQSLNLVEVLEEM